MTAWSLPGPATVMTVATIHCTLPGVPGLKWGEGDCALSSVGGQKQDAAHGLSMLSGEATCPERPLAGREWRAGWRHQDSPRLEWGMGVGDSCSSCPCSVEGSHPFLQMWLGGHQ